MKCPRCGADMKEGQMYCEHCGREIQIVPEFDPALETSLHKALSDVGTQIAEKASEDSKPETDAGQSTVPEKQPSMKNRRKKRWKVFAGLFAAAALCAGMSLIFWHHTPEYRYEKAAAQMKEKSYDSAAELLELLIEQDPRNVEYLNALSSCYYFEGKLEEAKELCLTILNMDASCEDAYRRCVAIYEKQNDYAAINALMQSCPDVQIQSRYLDYMANPPEFDLQSGTYREAQNLKLIGNAAGTIYFTTDGSVPDENSQVYTSPIPLKDGGYEIKALFVNHYGIASDISSANYYIDISRPDAPYVTPLPGNYDKPVRIDVDVPDGCSVYYTMDKTEPTASSTRYEEPFWLPVGYSTFKFVTIAPDGVTGSVTECNYTLDLHPLLSMEAASNQLLLTLKNAGVVNSLQGDVPDGDGRNLYTFKYALTINNHHYYLYREYHELDGESNATGNDYVVNYMSGECYRAEKQEDKSFKLYAIEQPENGQEYTVKDFRKEKLLLLEQEDTSIPKAYQLGFLQDKGIIPETKEYHNIDSILLDVSLDKGFAISDIWSRGAFDRNLSCLKLDQKMPICVAWPENHSFDEMRLFANLFKESMESLQ